MRHCNVCGRPIRTGIKYCYVCRSIQKAGGAKKDYSKFWVVALSGIIFSIVALFSKDKFLDLLGYVGFLFGFPLLIGLVTKFLVDRKRRKVNQTNSSNLS